MTVSTVKHQNAELLFFPPESKKQSKTQLFKPYWAIMLSCSRTKWFCGYGYNTTKNNFGGIMSQAYNSYFLPIDRWEQF